MAMKSFGLLAAFVFALGGCFSDPSKIVLEVGQFKFTQRDVNLRHRVLKIYYPHEAQIDAKSELVIQYKKVELLLRLGISDLRERIVKEDYRIADTTLDPEGLAKVRRVFEGDDEAYRRLYVTPVLISRLFGEVLRSHPELQKNSKQRAREFLAKAQAQPRKFAKLAQTEKLKLIRLEVSESEGLKSSPLDESRDLAEADETRDSTVDIDPKLIERWQSTAKSEAAKIAELWVREIAASAKPGQVCAGLIDHGDAWYVAKLIGMDKQRSTVSFLVAAIAKDSTEAWEKKELETVVVKTHSP